MFFKTCKFILITSLAVVFFVFFGHPSYVKYQRKDTVFTESNVEDGKIPPPAITIYAWRRSLFTGWKNSTVGKDSCNVSDTFDNYVQCVNDETFKLGDILLSASNGNHNLTKDAFWVS